MRSLLLPALLALSLAACSRGAEDGASAATASAVDAATAPAGATPAVAAPDGVAADVKLLEGHHWRLRDARDAGNKHIDALFASAGSPVQLDFAQGRLSISNTCNRMSGAYAIEGTRLEIGALMSTMMACADPALDALDRAVSARLEGSLPIAIHAAEGSPQLTLTSSAGDVLEFTGHPTAATRFGSAGATVFLEVAGHTRPCSDPLMPDQPCLQVREIRFDEQGLRTGTPGEFEHFYADIEGFSHEPGVRSVLRVRRYTRDPVPADASATAYVLDLVVESEQLQPPPAKP